MTEGFLDVWIYCVCYLIWKRKGHLIFVRVVEDGFYKQSGEMVTLEMSEISERKICSVLYEGVKIEFERLRKVPFLAICLGYFFLWELIDVF